MKINDHVRPGAPDRPGEAPGVHSDPTRTRGAGRTPAPAEDTVNVSDEARTLSRLRGELGDVDAIRTEKVEELRGQIERGEFAPDLKQVARKLLASIFGERLR
jgi:flagellar biosynthesis anti-sigma factor FlgM